MKSKEEWINLFESAVSQLQLYSCFVDWEKMKSLWWHSVNLNYSQLC